MKKIIPFKKNILFKTNLSEITSISLEDDLKFEKNLVVGQFIVSGEYKMNDTSVNTEPFIYNLPVEISIDEKYNLDNSTIEVSDFYYEIINNNTLNINIEVTMDKIEEMPIIEEVRNEIQETRNEDNKPNITEQDDDKLKEVEMERTDILQSLDKEEVSESAQKERCVEPEETLFKEISSEEVYISYSVYIVREGDTVDSILAKYGIDKEKLQEYNDLKDIKIGDKLIIPSNA